jgi:hypothetical protein
MRNTNLKSCASCRKPFRSVSRKRRFCCDACRKRHNRARTAKNGRQARRWPASRFFGWRAVNGELVFTPLQPLTVDERRRFDHGHFHVEERP